jgi:hypothetical protein
MMDLYNLDFKNCVGFASDAARKDYSEKGLFYIVSCPKDGVCAILLQLYTSTEHLK